MAQLAQSFGLDLADALAGDVELFAHLFQRAAAAIIQSKAQLQHFALALSQAIQDILHLLFEELMAGGIGWCESRVVLDEITQVAIIFLADGHLQAHRLLADFDDLAHLLGADLHLHSNLLGRWLAPQVLQQTPTDTNQAIDRLHHMYGNTNRASLIGDSTSDGL